MNNSINENDRTEHLLTEMYRNVKMGCEHIVGILPKVNDRFMISELTADLENYSKYAKTVGDMMHERGIEPKEPGMMAKMGTAAGIAVSTALDPTDRNIARIYSSSARSGMRRLSRLSDEAATACDARVLGVCGEIIESERLSLAKMEGYL